MYNRQVRTAKTQTVHIDPTQGYRSENGHDGEFRIEIVDRQSVKGRSRTYLLDAETGAYIAVRDGDYLKTADWNGKTVRLLTYADTVLQYAGEELEMHVKMDSVRTDDKGVRDTISVTVRTISSSIRSKTGAEESRYGMMYRGWGQFAYKGDTARADGGAGHQVSELIDTAELDKEQSISQEFQGTVKDMRSETAGGSAFSDEVTRATGTSDVNRFTGMTYQSRQDRYVASTRDVYVSRTGQSSSRQGKSYIDVASEIPSYPSAAEMAEGAYAAPAIRSTSSTKSGTLSGGL